MRQEFELTEADLKALLDASKPTPVMYLSGGAPMYRTPQENVNQAWKKLGERLGFDYRSVEPVRGKSVKFFSANVRKRSR